MRRGGPRGPRQRRCDQASRTFFATAIPRPTRISRMSNFFMSGVSLDAVDELKADSSRNDRRRKGVHHRHHRGFGRRARPSGGGERGLVAPLVFKTSGTGDPRPVGSIPATSANGGRVRQLRPSRVLLERRVDAEACGHDQAAQRLRHRGGELDRIVVGGREDRLAEAFERLSDERHLVAVNILDMEIPCPPVLGVDRGQFVAAGRQREPLLAHDVLLVDRADLGTVAVRNDELRLHDLGGAREAEHRLAVHVADLEPVGEVLVEPREQAYRLLELRLADLHDRADLVAVLVEHVVLVGELDQLRLLIDDEDGLGEQRAATGSVWLVDSRLPRQLVLDLLRVGRTGRRAGTCSAARWAPGDRVVVMTPPAPAVCSRVERPARPCCTPDRRGHADAIAETRAFDPSLVNPPSAV